MLNNVLSESDLTELLGQSLIEVWQDLCKAIDEKYDMDRIWNTGGQELEIRVQIPPGRENSLLTFRTGEMDQIHGYFRKG